MAIGIVKIAHHNKGNRTGKPNTLGYLLLPLLTPLLIDIQPVHLGLKHILRESRDNEMGQEPAGEGSNHDPCEVEAIQDHPQGEHCDCYGRQADFVLIHFLCGNY